MPRFTPYAIALCFVSAAAHARPAEYEVNVREACRQAIAGAYLQAYDDRERTKTMIEALSAQDQVVGEALKTARAAFAEADAAARTQEFDVAIAGRRDETASVVAGLTKQRADGLAARQGAQATLGELTAAELRLRELTQRVFHIEREGDRPDGGYPIRLSYRAACPKYRALCPLPAKDAANLALIGVGGASPEPCVRYANFTKIR